ncbi:TrmH family RNA methyltransferase [Kutzneria albida]|uniref:TrmH family RNA methyltransferase n=1 Tax=Kutzneria albida TaxID=43357 RepID=UPI001F27E951|nr:TrmH family RNA methyltransferase [Kutzneria albida]
MARARREAPHTVDHAAQATHPSEPTGRRDLRRSRRRGPHSCWDHLLLAPLWPLHGANLGTLLRTCDAVGACLAVPRHPWVPEALARGTPCGTAAACAGSTPRGAGLPISARPGPRWWRWTGGGAPLADLSAARGRTVVLLGHEQHGVPPEALRLVHQVVEIPMVGTRLSLTVAVAGSLVAYRLAGLL